MSDEPVLQDAAGNEGGDAQPGASPAAAKPKAFPWTVLRRGLALAIAIAIAAFAAAALLSPDFESCHDAIARVATEPAVRLCGPADPAELLPFVLVLVLLLLPDLSEVAIPGLGSRKLRVEAQAERQELLEERLLLVQQSAVQAQNQYVIVGDPGALLNRVNAKEAEFQSMVAGLPTPFATTAEGPEVAALSAKILETWEAIAPYAGPLDVPPRVREGWPSRFRPPPSLSPRQREVVERWQHLFQDEIAALRTARNKVAHPPQDLTPDELETFAAIGERLRTLLLQGLEGAEG